MDESLDESPFSDRADPGTIERPNLHEPIHRSAVPDKCRPLGGKKNPGCEVVRMGLWRYSILSFSCSTCCGVVSLQRAFDSACLCRFWRWNLAGFNIKTASRSSRLRWGLYHGGRGPMEDV